MNRRTLVENLLDLMKNVRVWILFFFVIMAFVAIGYNFQDDGIVINGIVPGSPAEKAGMSYDRTTSQTNLEEVLSVSGQPVSSVSGFFDTLNGLENPDSVTITTDKNQEGYTIAINNTGNRSLGDVLGVSVRDEPTSNLRLGIELEGGSRLILNPVQNLSDSEYELLVNALQSRLDVYGASGTKVNQLTDAFTGERFVVVESISANKNDIFELIQRQGEFEARISNETVFTGENVLRVLNDPGNERLQGCPQTGSGYRCTYAFSVEIDGEGSDGFYNQTKDLTIQNGYLSEQVAFFMDGNEITSLNIASSFKFQRVTTPQITVSGETMPTQTLAEESARKEMEFLQAILSTQSLPSELTVEQSYAISSSVGKQLLENALLVGLAAVLVVAAVVALRYREILLFVGISLALLTEIFIVLGAAAFLKLSIDLAAIGGLIAAIGTGVDDQIIITDEYFRKRKKFLKSKLRVRHAITIIMIAYLTTLAAMVPLYVAGLQLLQGFAFMIIIGVSVGVFITRPAYAAFLRIMKTTRAERKEEEEQ